MHVESSSLRSVREFPISLSPGQRCPYCHADVHESQALIGCPDCLVVLHDSCAPRGRCTTLGCSNGPRLKSTASSEERPPRRGGWGRGRSPRARRRKLRLLAWTALCFGAGFWACYQPAEVPTPMPVPFVVAPRLSLDVNANLTDYRDGLATVTGTVTIDTSEASRGDFYDPLTVYVAGQPATLGPAEGFNARVSRAAFTARIPVRAGWQTLSVVASWGGGYAESQADVVLSSYVAPAPPQPAPIVRDLVVPARVDSDLLLVEGVVPAELAWADVTIQGPMGQVELGHQPPGPFTGAVTLPGPGRYEVTVTVRDPQGRTQVYRQVVVR